LSITKNAENEELANQISTIRETVKTILKNVQFGSNENLLRDLAKIDTTASRMQSKMTGTPFVRKYKKILVPYDGSSFSKKALSEALELAKSFNSKVHVLSVIEVASDLPSGVLSEVINKKLTKLKRDISLPKKFSNPKKLQQQINESAKYGVDVQVELLIGNAADSILKFANQNKVDLITIGSKGLRGMKKITALGSVSRRVSEEAKCPIMIIR
jgi:nucleotide-binding universal stress UspA family protein